MLPGTFLRARAIGLMPMIDQVEVALYSSLYFILFGEMKKSRVRVFGRGDGYPIAFLIFSLLVICLICCY